MAGTISTYSATIKIMEFQSTVSAGSGTTTAVIVASSHGLSDGDMIVNQTRRGTSILTAERGSRKITRIDDDSFLVYPNIASQQAGDIIELHKFVDRTAYVLDGSLQINLRSGGQNEASFILKETYS